MRKVILTLIVSLISINTIIAKTIQVPQDYPDIQTAIDNALPFDTISVDQGVYKGSLLIGIPLTIEGKEGTRPIIYKEETESSTIIPLIMTGKDIRVVLKNLTLSGTAPDKPFLSSEIGIIAQETNLNLEKVDITGFYIYSLIQTGGSLSCTDTRLLPNKQWETPVKGGFYLYGLKSINIDYFSSDISETDAVIHIADSIPFKERFALNTRSFISAPVTGTEIKPKELSQLPTSIVRIYSSRFLLSDKKNASAILVTGKANMIMLDNYIYSSVKSKADTKAAPSAIRITGQTKLKLVKSRITDSPRAITIENTNKNIEVSIEESSIINNNTAIQIDNAPLAKVDMGGGALGSNGNNIIGNIYSEIRITGKTDIFPIYAINNKFRNTPVIIINNKKAENTEELLITEKKDQ